MSVSITTEATEEEEAADEKPKRRTPHGDVGNKTSERVNLQLSCMNSLMLWFSIICCRTALASGQNRPSAQASPSNAGPTPTP